MDAVLQVVLWRRIAIVHEFSFMAPTSKEQINQRRIFYGIALIFALYILLSRFIPKIQHPYLKIFTIVGLLVVCIYLLVTWKSFWKST